MRENLILLFCLLFLPAACFGEEDTLPAVRAQDSVPSGNIRAPFPYLSQVIPGALIVAGTAFTLGNVNKAVSVRLPETRISLDNYLEYAPIAGLYLADIAGVQSRNSVWDQTKYLALSQLATTIIVQTLKRTASERRPDREDEFDSFPSGHAAVAFTGATVLYHEFKETNTVLAYSGFVVATAVGVLRMTNRRHWISDVLAGAGIGILSVNMIYYFEPLKRWQPFSRSLPLTLLPYYNGES
ncbi:MAG: phosphatase PAP2 family protein, partial [Candidatus Symbiothrix sp.]|nr:phosphatase PAP2 family protein [Candidatus Symbiothrix sp.]